MLVDINWPVILIMLGGAALAIFAIVKLVSVFLQKK